MNGINSLSHVIIMSKRNDGVGENTPEIAEL